MLTKHKILIAALLGFSFGISSCKKYLDVNTNPNVAQAATEATLLPSGEVAIASSLGVDFQVNGCIWGQFWTQSPEASQYRPMEQYQPSSQYFETPWDNLYSTAGENLLQLYKQAKADNKKQYMAISLLLRAYTFQLITDAWGDVPFSQALKGLQADGGITSPAYDVQQSIYADILTYIDSANALIDPSDPAAPGTDDLIYNGEMAKWQKFSNTLKLKILMRMSNKNPAFAQTGLAALYASSPAFIGTGDDALVKFTSASGNKNPFYSEVVGLQNTQNVVASNTCIDSMLSNNDARIGFFYEMDANNTYSGVDQGSEAAFSTVSVPSFNVGADALNSKSATAPVKFMTSYESYFLQAEAIARGLVTGSNDAALFTQGIQASFSACGIPDSATSYLANANWAQYPTDPALKVKWIITQKWFSMCGNQGFEAWTEWRRTGYPDFFVFSSEGVGSKFPRRFLYPTSEINTNAKFPGLIPVTTSVWWDIH